MKGWSVHKAFLVGLVLLAVYLAASHPDEYLML
jgi:hypothetical protein